ncbi:hypothetical protein Q1695_003765 [Nippostrongylus brasiliensis]|nr:hypothetical protein Q1695_003765 [Nippostrongylus brasiliensis]
MNFTAEVTTRVLTAWMFPGDQNPRFPCNEDEEEAVCTKQCVVNACQCKQAYIRDKKGGACISVDDCPRATSCEGFKCPTGKKCQMIYPPCLPDVAPRFNLRRFEQVMIHSTMVCTKNCIVNVCQCKPGFFRNANGECVETCIDGRSLWKTVVGDLSLL